jgi:hypothetical protein
MSEKRFALVQRDDDNLSPYPYIYVNDDGSYRELSSNEKAYLQEEFSPFDGDRPYVKSRYWQKSADGNVFGFLKRKKLPRCLKEGEIPDRKKWWEFWKP